jgi:hypothetical protein
VSGKRRKRSEDRGFLIEYGVGRDVRVRRREHIESVERHTGGIEEIERRYKEGHEMMMNAGTIPGGG